MIWEKQWELFAPNFKNGKAHIETPVGVIQLLPGPGFGDYSHPTTRLTCKLMAKGVCH
jgi:ribosomal protein L11 methyltransferase